MEKEIGWYRIKNESADQGECMDESKNLKCFYKKQNYEQYQEIIFQKMKWNRLKNVVTLYDYYVEGDNMFLFMELCSDNLQNYFNNFSEQQKTELNLQFYQELIFQVSRGYLELKNLKVLHRDIKPTNILVVKDNNNITYKIGDFDISVSEENQVYQGNRKLQTYNQKGTKKYAAPEIAESQYSCEADMFSFGLMIFELLTGENCFNKNYNAVTTLHQKLQKMNIRQILKESEETITYNIDAKGIEKMKMIFNKMVVFDPAKRISWEDLNRLIYNLEELEKIKDEDFKNDKTVQKQNNLEQQTETKNSSVKFQIPTNFFQYKIGANKFNFPQFQQSQQLQGYQSTTPAQTSFFSNLMNQSPGKIQFNNQPNFQQQPHVQNQPNKNGFRERIHTEQTTWNTNQIPFLSNSKTLFKIEPIYKNQ